jgi:hypothetical protein
MADNAANVIDAANGLGALGLGSNIAPVALCGLLPCSLL